MSLYKKEYKLQVLSYSDISRYTIESGIKEGLDSKKDIIWNLSASIVDNKVSEEEATEDYVYSIDYSLSHASTLHKDIESLLKRLNTHISNAGAKCITMSNEGKEERKIRMSDISEEDMEAILKDNRYKVTFMYEKKNALFLQADKETLYIQRIKLE